MPVLCIGADIVENERFKAAMSERFLLKYFSQKENEFLAERKMNVQSAAASFAAKEAFVKALGTGFVNIHPKDIEVLRDERGKPFINAVGSAKVSADNMGVKNIHVTLTHEKNYALAFVVLEG